MKRSYGEMPKRPEIRHKEQRAYYQRESDYINVPRIETFNKSEDYYSTLLHEIVHSTGHSERLNRKELLESKGFRTEDYAIEELTAEMGASYLVDNQKGHVIVENKRKS